MGYLVTPELRRVMGRPTTAGRVQSVAVYLVVLREREIRAFTAIKYFGVELTFVSPSDGRTWTAEWDPVPVFASKEFPYVQDRQLAELVGLYAMSSSRPASMAKKPIRLQLRSSPPRSRWPPGMR